MEHVKKSITINRPRQEVFQFWRQFDNLGRFMHHLIRVDVTGPGRSHWVARGPAGLEIEWDAEIVEELANDFILWRSLDSSDVRNSGAVRFKDAPGDRGTEVDVELHYEAPGGKAGAAVAKWFGEEPNQQLTDDLRRLKQVLETGEVLRSEGSLEGVGQGASKQRPSQAPAEVEA
jgi:uncharacterized membrane protein